MADSLPAHLVLARKWRPERFGDLVGQEHITRTLAEAIKRGRIAHAFLFTGIRGVGKTTAARILARCLNCETGPTPEPCGNCAACVEIRAGRALDVSEIDGATYRKIDDARAIIENLSYRPARDRFKIYIIDEAHQLTDQAFNALLKTLEEPPPHVKFILATTEPQKMPETILSRLQRYDFRRIALQTIFARLKALSARENIEAEEGALMLLAREAGGSMRDAERMLETAIACAAEERVTEAEVAATLGVASRAVVYELCEAILNRDGAGALRRVRELHSRGANLEALGRDLLEAFRNLAVAKLPAGDAQSPLAELPDHEAAELRRLSASASNRDLMRLFRLMAEAQEEILRSPYPDLLMEMAALRMAALAPVMDADELLRALASTGAPPASGAPPSASSASGCSSPGASGATRRIRMEGEVKAGAPQRTAPPDVHAPEPDLPQLRDHIRAHRPALAGFMEQGAALSLDGDIVTIGLRNDIYVRYLNDNCVVIAELASGFYGRPIKVRLVTSGNAARTGAVGDGAGADAPAGVRAAPGSAGTGSERRQALLADPEMRRILETLEARLVEVRVRKPAVDGGTTEANKG